jgi:hypothetical protein
MWRLQWLKRKFHSTVEYITSRPLASEYVQPARSVVLFIAVPSMPGGRIRGKGKAKQVFGISREKILVYFNILLVILIQFTAALL